MKSIFTLSFAQSKKLNNELKELISIFQQNLLYT